MNHIVSFQLYLAPTSEGIGSFNVSIKTDNIEKFDDEFNMNGEYSNELYKLLEEKCREKEKQMAQAINVNPTAFEGLLTWGKPAEISGLYSETHDYVYNS